ncbi:MAG: hypothetical protein Q8P67_23790, partial [archaeon]|nr:hypothetical protein [archaeon]
SSSTTPSHLSSDRIEVTDATVFVTGAEFSDSSVHLLLSHPLFVRFLHFFSVFTVFICSLFNPVVSASPELLRRLASRALALFCHLILLVMQRVYQPLHAALSPLFSSKSHNS